MLITSTLSLQLQSLASVHASRHLMGSLHHHLLLSIITIMPPASTVIPYQHQGLNICASFWMHERLLSSMRVTRDSQYQYFKKQVNKIVLVHNFYNTSDQLFGTLVLAVHRRENAIFFTVDSKNMLDHSQNHLNSSIVVYRETNLRTSSPGRPDHREVIKEDDY